MKISARDIRQLQEAQARHDDDCHKDIAMREPNRRLQHLAVHFGKYLCRLLENREATLDTPIIRKTMLDAALIALSMANVSRTDISILAETLPEASECTLETLIQQLVPHIHTALNASDKLDHMESGNHTASYGTAASGVFQVCLAYCAHTETDLFKAIAGQQTHIRFAKVA